MILELVVHNILLPLRLKVGSFIMNNNLVWQQNSSDLNNGENLDEIARWWSSLAGKEIAWKQRLLLPDNDLESIDWQPQKFDEQFAIATPQLRGITLFWRDRIGGEERNITPKKLQLNLTQRQLLVFPQSQAQVVIKINLPGVIYQKLNLIDPEVAATVKNNTGTILLRDEAQKLEIKVTLDGDKLNLLRDRLKITEN